MKKANKKILAGILCIFVISFSIVSIFFLKDYFLRTNYKEGDYIEKNNHPRGIRLTFIHNLNDSIRITWFSELGGKDPVVKYSLKPDLSNAIKIEAKLIGIISVFIFSAELFNLLPNTTYYYQISSDYNNEREIMKFTTLANYDSKHFRFLVYGDTRTQRASRSILAKKIIKTFYNDFDFTIHTGDIVEFGAEQNEWNDYFLDTECINAYKQGIYVEGNHEQGKETLMYYNLPMPNDSKNRYYYFSYGGVGFIILNSNKYTRDDDIQTEWLNKILFNLSQENVFNFAFLHHALLHDEESYTYHRDNWNPLFMKYNVSLIICGHIHHYERSFPMISNSIPLQYDDSELYNFTNIKDPIYIVSGGGGAPLEALHNDFFIAKNEMAYNFLLIDMKKEATKATIYIEAWGMPENLGNLYLIDNITITNWN